MNECIGCKFYDISVDCCNADENCYKTGIIKYRDMIIQIIEDSGMISIASVKQIAERLTE